jgi:predicted Ser/Thr protein kinase
MEFVKGERIDRFLEKAKQKEIALVFRIILNQCFEMDKMKVNKFEMHNPYKHIIVGRWIVLIDFERCRYVQDPKNVSQFVQFINKSGFCQIGLDIVKEYKRDMSDKNFRRILNSV